MTTFSAMKRLPILALLLALTAALRRSALAQREQSVWFFGQQAGLSNSRPMAGHPGSAADQQDDDL